MSAADDYPNLTWANFRAMRAEIDRLRAVIAAAKAWRDVNTMIADDLDAAELALAAAVDALVAYETERNL